MRFRPLPDQTKSEVKKRDNPIPHQHARSQAVSIFRNAQKIIKPLAANDRLMWHAMRERVGRPSPTTG